MRGSWRPNITEIFLPRSYGCQRCIFLVLHGCSTGALESTLLGAGFPYYHSSISVSKSTQLSVFCSIFWPFINFKLPRSDMDTPPQFLPISGDRDVSLPLSLEWPVWSSSSGNNCHAVQRSLSSGASVYESIMGFFFTSSHFISQFPPTRFPLITATECVTSFRCITLNGILGRVKRSKHNTASHFPSKMSCDSLVLLGPCVTRPMCIGSRCVQICGAALTLSHTGPWKFPETFTFKIFIHLKWKKNIDKIEPRI